MTRRQEFSSAVKRAAAERADDRCENCTARLSYRSYHYFHDLLDWLGGAAILAYRRVLCLTCRRDKTSKQAPDRASPREDPGEGGRWREAARPLRVSTNGRQPRPSQMERSERASRRSDEEASGILNRRQTSWRGTCCRLL